MNTDFSEGVRWKQRFQNYEKAYLSLLESAEALEQEPSNRFIQDSLIQRYEYTIELAWKTLKDYLEELGFVGVTSPKKVIRKAYQEGLIAEADKWIVALNDRNRTSHAYEETMAKTVATAIMESHIPLFGSLYATLKHEPEAMAQFGLTAVDQQIITAIFDRYPRIDAAILFGSRAMNRFKPSSDIDFAVKGTDIFEIVGALNSDFDESDLIYEVDIVAYETITSSALREHIDRVGKLFYEREGDPADRPHDTI